MCLCFHTRFALDGFYSWYIVVRVCGSEWLTVNAIPWSLIHVLSLCAFLSSIVSLCILYFGYIMDLLICMYYAELIYGSTKVYRSGENNEIELIIISGR